MVSGIVVTEMGKGDLPFLLDLWHMPEVMRYADEFPRLRGWSKSDDIESAWKRYQEKRDDLGKEYTQLILRLENGTPVGESFFVLLDEEATFGKWQKPEDIAHGTVDEESLLHASCYDLGALKIQLHADDEAFPPHFFDEGILPLQIHEPIEEMVAYLSAVLEEVILQQHR